MRAPSWSVSVVLFAIVAVACIGDAVETTTTPTTSTTATSSTTVPTTTMGEAPGRPIREGPQASCFYLAGYLAVREGEGPNAIEALSGFDVELAIASPADVLGESEAAEALDNAVDLLSTNVDPLDVATALESAQPPVPAAPVYAMGLAGHWALKPGTEPISSPGETIIGPNARVGDGVIAVVDSGIVDDPQVEDDLPAWMSPGNVLFDPDLDTETVGLDTDVASHGTFVTSLIRQLAPEYRVAFASAHAVPTGVIVERDDGLPVGLDYVTTELHVAEAMVRVMQRPELNAENVAALNLSLGTYSCVPEEDPTMVTTMAAMRLWFETFPSSVVFAAAGNEPYQEPFWPAGLSYYQLDATINPDRVRGVAAVNESAEEVVWSRPVGASAAAAVPTRAPPRPWVTDLAPGCDLLGLRGGVDLDGATIVAWSGSSFATAVSAALQTAGVPPTSTGAATEYDYTAPDLHFERHGSCDLP